MTEEVKAGKYILKRTVYDHGGSRIWVEGENGDRDLIADTYGSKIVSDLIWNYITFSPELSVLTMLEKK